MSFKTSKKDKYNIKEEARKTAMAMIRFTLAEKDKFELINIIMGLIEMRR